MVMCEGKGQYDHRQTGLLEPINPFLLYFHCRELTCIAGTRLRTL
jgi:hypothetical protein